MTDVEGDMEDSSDSVYEKSASAPSSPSDRKSSINRDLENLACHVNGRRVTFPDDDTIVTGYFDAPDPWGDDLTLSPDNIVAAYRAACWKQGVKPLQRVLQQLQNVQLNESTDFELNLKGENLDSQHCEALEEIFKRLHFKKLVLESSNLDDEGAAALFDMIEYYDSTSHLNIAGNRRIGGQGWHACSKMLKRTPCLQYLDAHNTAQCEQSLLILGRAFRTGSNLTVLNLEGCGITGRALVILVAALKLNMVLLELYLGENKIVSADGLQLGNLLRSNSTLELLDLRKNNLQDLGVCHLIDGLCQQIPTAGECLKSLNLSSNHLTHSGMAHVNQALIVSTSLSSLNISNNNVGNEGVHVLKQGLLHNQSLRSLVLQDTKITCEGAITLAEYIADNQYISHLDLRKNNIQVGGVMALALSMKHNHSITSLELDEVIPTTTNAPDGVQNSQQLLQEIQEYCQRNKKGMEVLDESPAEEKNFVPTVHNDSELSAVICEKTAVSRTQSVNPSHVGPHGMTSSASFPTGAKATQYSSTNARNRFQVCRVFLESDTSRSKDEAVFFPSSPSETSEDSQDLSDAQMENSSDENAAESNSPSGVSGTKERVSVSFTVEADNCSDEALDGERGMKSALAGSPGSETSKENAPKVVKKIAFLLPEDADLQSCSKWKDRRLSTPAPASVRIVKEKPQFRLKLDRQLESLDLKSSVPLSPTRLREGLVFPEPYDLKIPGDCSPTPTSK